MKRKSLALLLTVAVIMIIGSSLALAADHMIIGAKKCSMCHKKKTGNQAGIWAKSAHAGAFLALKNEKAAAVTKKRGLGNAWEEAECLACHDTKAFLGAELDPKSKYKPDEGVSCEACHGAGSGYKSKKVMKDREAAIKKGLLIQGKELCVKCHNEKSPFFKDFNFEERWAQIAHPVPEK